MEKTQVLEKFILQICEGQVAKETPSLSAVAWYPTVQLEELLGRSEGEFVVDIFALLSYRPVYDSFTGVLAEQFWEMKA